MQAKLRLEKYSIKICPMVFVSFPGGWMWSPSRTWGRRDISCWCLANLDQEFSVLYFYLAVENRKFGCRCSSLTEKNPMSVEDDIPSPLQARPFPPTWVCCGLALCCRNAHACKLLGRDVLHRFPRPEWSKCCIFSPPAFGDVGSCRPVYLSQEYGNHMAKAKWMGTRGWGPRVCQQGLA